MPGKPVGYTLVPYDELPMYIGKHARFLYRTPAGKLFVHKGAIELLGLAGEALKLLLRYNDEFLGGIVIDPTDRVYIKV